MFAWRSVTLIRSFLVLRAAAFTWAFACQSAKVGGIPILVKIKRGAINDRSVSKLLIILGAEQRIDGRVGRLDVVPVLFGWARPSGQFFC